MFLNHETELVFFRRPPDWNFRHRLGGPAEITLLRVTSKRSARRGGRRGWRVARAFAIELRERLRQPLPQLQDWREDIAQFLEPAHGFPRREVQCITILCGARSRYFAPGERHRYERLIALCPHRIDADGGLRPRVLRPINHHFLFAQSLRHRTYDQFRMLLLQ